MLKIIYLNLVNNKGDESVNIIERYKFQRGNVQTRSHNNLSCESAIDRYIIARNKNRLIIDETDYQNTLKAAAEDFIDAVTAITKDFD